MSKPLSVDLGALRAALSDVLDLVEQQFGTEVPLDVDYYWHLPVEAAFDVTHQPTAFTAGQVSDDIADAFEDPGERLTGDAWHDLSHLIGVLRALELRART